MSRYKHFIALLLFACIALSLTGCDRKNQIVSQVDEREANVILVFLASKGIPATKSEAASAGIGVDNTAVKFNIFVDESQMINAMAILNQNGLPRRHGTNLLTLFAKQGMMSSDKEETIRYQAGLEQQITNTVLLMDGVIDATVQLSFPPEESIPGVESKLRPTAAVYVKHQGIIDDPNIFLENKIKRLVSGSVNNLDINDVTVVSDRSRFTDILTSTSQEGSKISPKEYVSIWSIVMSKHSATRFRVIFFFITILAIIFAVAVGWIIWKIYPMIKRKGIKVFLTPDPIVEEKYQQEKQPNPQQPPNE